MQGVKNVLAHMAASHPAAGMQYADALHKLGVVFTFVWHAAAVRGVKDVLAYVAASHPAAGMQNADALHNLGSVAVSLPGAVRALQKDLGSDLQHIFSKTKNCPTKNVRAPPGTAM